MLCASVRWFGHVGSVGARGGLCVHAFGDYAWFEIRGTMGVSEWSRAARAVLCLYCGHAVGSGRGYECVYVHVCEYCMLSGLDGLA